MARPTLSLVDNDDNTDAIGKAADFLRLKAWVKNALDKHSDFYTEAQKCFEFVGGKQWDTADADKLKLDNKPPIVFNITAPTVDAICGMEVNNRQEVKYLPRTNGAIEINERLSSLADWARDNAQAEDEESTAFRDALICGRGWTETRLDFDIDPMGQIVIDRVDPMEVGVDPNARKPNLADARYIFRFKDIDTADAETQFPGIPPSKLDANWANTINARDGGEGNKRDYPEETRDSLKRTDWRPKTVRVVQIQWWETKPAYLVAMPGMQAQPKQVPAGVWEKAKDAAEAAGMRGQKITVRVFKQAFLGADGLLAGEDDDAIVDVDGFSLCATTGRWDADKKYHYGIVRPMMDPQRIVNKTLVQTIHIFSVSSKGGLLAEKGAFANPRDAERDWSDPSTIVTLMDGALSGGRVKERPVPQMPPVLANLLEFALNSIRNVTGVNMELMGAADREQAASLEYQRRQSAMSILAPWFDGLRRYRKTQGHVLIACLRKLPPGVLVRIVQEEDQPQAALPAPGMPQGAPGQQMVPQQPGQPQQPQGEPQPAFVPFDPAYFGLSNDQEKFDIIVDEAPSSPNQREATWAAMQPFAEQLAVNPKAVAVLLKYSPLPSAAAKELTAAITEGPQIPPELQQEIEQGKQLIAEQAKKIEQLESDKAIEAAKIQAKAQSDAAANQTDQFNAETDRIHKVGQLGGDEDQGDGDKSEVELLKQSIELRFEADAQERKQQHEVLMQHLKNLGQIAASRVRADATADAGIEASEQREAGE